MKTELPSRRKGGRKSERGIAVIIVIAFVAILLVYLAANLMTLSRLSRELRLLEQKQTQRFSHERASTNAVQGAIPPAPRP